LDKNVGIKKIDTYVKGAKLVLSNDAFGQHFSPMTLFNDEVNECELYQEAPTSISGGRVHQELC